MKRVGAEEETNELPPKIVLATPLCRAVLLSERIVHSDKVRRQVVVERLQKDSMGGERWAEQSRHPETEAIVDLLVSGVREGVPLPSPYVHMTHEVAEVDPSRKKFTLELTKDELAILRYVMGKVGRDDSDPLKDTYEMEDEPEEKYAVLDEVHDKVMMLRWEEPCR